MSNNTEKHKKLLNEILNGSAQQVDFRAFNKMMGALGFRGADPSIESRRASWASRAYKSTTVYMLDGRRLAVPHNVLDRSAITGIRDVLMAYQESTGDNLLNKLEERAKNMHCGQQEHSGACVSF